jgi:tetratricopeptide (TPR) repeat protein
MDLTSDQKNQLEKLGLMPTPIIQTTPKVNLVPLFSISGITLLSIGGLILLKSKNSASNIPVSNFSSQKSIPSPTQVPKSIQHYLLTSQQYFTKALEAQSTKIDNQTIISYLNESITAASEAIKTSPSDYRGYEQRAKIYQSLLDTQPQLLASAINDYQQALTFNKNSAELTRQLASLYAKKGDVQNTLTYLSATVSLEPTKAQNFYDLARIQQQAGLLPDALNTYNQLLPLITDTAQKSQVEIEKQSLEKIVASVRTDSNIRPSNNPSPTTPPIQTEGNLLQASNTTGLIIAAPEISKNISVENQTDSNSLSGTATLSSGQKEILIQNSKLTSSSQVYLTILTGGKNQSLELLGKSKKSFTAGFSSPLSEDVTFKWWIVN